jgi:hypothetical protein
MARSHVAWLEHQLKRWMRPDAHRYVRPDFERFLKPGPEGDLLRRLYRRADTPNARQSSSESRVEIVKADPAAEAALAHRRWQIAALRLDWELLKFSLGGRKALHPSHNQPRVPAGNPDGGQWTSEGAQGTPTQIAGKLPGIGHNRGPRLKDIPKTKPRNDDDRIAAIKLAAKWRGPFAVLFAAAGWLREYAANLRSYRDPPKTFEELQRGASDLPKSGYEKHHINEKSAARDADFPESWIEGPNNIVAVPTLKHREITGWYASKNHEPPFNGLSPREYLRDKTWEERRRIGVQTLIDFGVLKP